MLVLPASQAWTLHVAVGNRLAETIPGFPVDFPINLSSQTAALGD